VIITFENHDYTEVENNAYFASLATRGVLLSNYYAIRHPSQPNYIAQVAGDTLGIDSDSSKDLTQTSVIDLFEAAGVTWKAYMEDYVPPCNPATQIGRYVRKHNPFISFLNVRNHSNWCAKIVEAKQIEIDLANKTLPEYIYYTPNLDNDAHDTNITYASVWLKGFLEPKLADPYFFNNTLIVITWDEDDYLEENHIYTALVGGVIKPGTKDNTRYDHYSLLRTVEVNWGLNDLGRNDKTATPYGPSNFQ